MTCPEQTTSAKEVFSFSSALAACLCYVEVLRAYRRDDWMSQSAMQWLGVAIGFVAYALALTLITSFLLYIVRLIRRKREAGRGLLCISVVVAGLVLLASLSNFSEVRGKFILVMACGITGYGILLFLVGRLWQNLSQAFGLIVVMSCLSGLVGLVSGSYAFLFFENKDLYVYGFSLGCASAATLVGALAALKRNRWLRFCSCAALIMIACAPALAVKVRIITASRADNSLEPSIVLIVNDALRADYCSVYGGNAPTPTLEYLAEKGALFEKCYSMAPWTVPSMFGMFASNYHPGLTPGSSEEQWIQESAQYVFDKKSPTLAEILSEKGYQTAAFVGNHLLGAENGILRGFDCSRVYYHHAQSKEGLMGRMPFIHEAVSRLFPGKVWTRPLNTSKLLTYQAREFIRRNKGKSLFMWIHYMDPHDPYDPPEEYRSMDGPWPFYAANMGFWKTPRVDSNKKRWLSDNERDYIRSLYEGEIQYVDLCIGKVVQELEHSNMGDSTFLAITGDHGEEFWKHGRWGHGKSLFDGTEWVPLIFSGPGIVPNRISRPVSGLDVMPTLAGLAGIETPSQWRGLDFSSALRDGNATFDRPICFAQSTDQTIEPRVPLQMAVDGKFKLVRQTEGTESWLYDVENDPDELSDLSNGEPELLKRMHSELDAWGNTFKQSFGESGTTGITKEEQEENLRKLEAMGYIH